MNAEKELEVLILKYKMETSDLLKDHLADIIREILEGYVKKYGPKVIVRGIKRSDAKYHPMLSLIAEKTEIIGVMDKVPFAEKVCISEDKEVPFIDINKTVDCDFYIINSLYSGKDIFYEIKQTLEQSEIGIVDLYQDIRMKYSMCVSRIYEEYGSERDFSYNRLKESLNNFRKKPEKKSLKRLLSVCLSMRDFVAFFRYVREGNCIIQNDEELKNLVSEVRLLLDKIRIQLKLRYKKGNGGKDIVIHWIDQLGYDELQLMPKLQERLQKGLFFNQAYTVTPYTRPTARMLFWKEFRGVTDLSISGSYRKWDLKESSMYQHIINANYEFGCFGLVKKILDANMEKDEMCEESIASSMHYWNMVTKLLRSKKPVFYIVHVLQETHEPYESPEVVLVSKSYEFQNSYEASKDKIEVSTKYADEVVDFYSEILGENIASLYMSDHGKWEDIDRRRYKDEVMHTFMGITNIGISGKVDRLFSYQYFDELVAWILKMLKPQEMFFCDIPIYSKGFKAVIKEREENDTDICKGYKGIKTPHDKYLKMDSGEEYYFQVADEQNNRIEDLSCEQRINNLRRRCASLQQEIIQGIE